MLVDEVPLVISIEVAIRLATDIRADLANKLLPEQLRLLSYEDMVDSFASAIPVRISELVPVHPAVPSARAVFVACADEFERVGRRPAEVRLSRDGRQLHVNYSPWPDEAVEDALRRIALRPNLGLESMSIQFVESDQIGHSQASIADWTRPGQLSRSMTVRDL